MACCNRRREALAAAPTTPRPAPRPAPAPPSARTSVRYLGHAAVIVRGPATGVPYAFTPDRPIRAVDRPRCGGDVAVEVVREGMEQRSQARWFRLVTRVRSPAMARA